MTKQFVLGESESETNNCAIFCRSSQHVCRPLVYQRQPGTSYCVRVKKSTVGGALVVITELQERCYHQLSYFGTVIAAFLQKYCPRNQESRGGEDVCCSLLRGTRIVQDVCEAGTGPVPARVAPL